MDARRAHAVLRALQIKTASTPGKFHRDSCPGSCWGSMLAKMRKYLSGVRKKPKALQDHEALRPLEPGRNGAIALLRRSRGVPWPNETQLYQQ